MSHPLALSADQYQLGYKQICSNQSKSSYDFSGEATRMVYQGEAMGFSHQDTRKNTVKNLITLEKETKRECFQ